MQPSNSRLAMGNELHILPYSCESENIWNRFVAESRNGTFLLDRRFMDYHSDRFEDCSLLFLKGEKVLGCFPANHDAGSHAVWSHQGLTYGGLILHPKATATQAMEMLRQLRDYYACHFKVEKLIYKAIPHIYHRQPCEEDLYALFVEGACLHARGLASAIDLSQEISFSRNRCRMIHKAEEARLHVYATTDATEQTEYWQLLNHVLTSRHGVRPVHSAEEMRLLTSRFPEQCIQWICSTENGELVAGAWVFLCNGTAHVQYGSTSNHGKELGALDLLYSHLINTYRDTHHYLEFGVSTEDGGRFLNEQLIHQKEGFGGRGICYDIYEMKIKG